MRESVLLKLLRKLMVLRDKVKHKAIPLSLV